MWKSSLKLFRNQLFKVLQCNKVLISIYLKWLKWIQNLTGSPLYDEKLPVATNIGKGWISNPDDKIATDHGNKDTTNNRTATRVISASGPHLLMQAMNIVWCHVVWLWLQVKLHLQPQLSDLIIDQGTQDYYLRDHLELSIVSSLLQFRSFSSYIHIDSIF